jgi:hypothetical protein
MSEQMSMGGIALPDAFVAAWREREAQTGKRSVLANADVIKDRWGKWWIVVDVDGRRHALMGRTDLEVAARDLFTMVFGTIGAP